MAKAKKGSSGRREVACNAILDATSQIIAEKGIDAFTITEIGLRAKINRALIYHYFGDRDNLVVSAIDHVMRKYAPFYGAEGIKRGVQMSIEHPEVARFFFQMLLNGRPLPGIGPRMKETAEAVERLGREQKPPVKLDGTFAAIMTSLALLSWSFSRREFARMLDISLKEADTRFAAQVKRSTEISLTSAPD